MNRESVSVLQVKLYCFLPNTEWFFQVMVLGSITIPEVSQGSCKEHSQALNWAAFFFPNELWVVCKNGTPVKCADGHIACKHRNFTPLPMRICLNLTLFIKASVHDTKRTARVKHQTQVYWCRAIDDLWLTCFSVFWPWLVEQNWILGGVWVFWWWKRF